MRKYVKIGIALIVAVILVLVFVSYENDRVNKDSAYIKACEYIQNGDFSSAYNYLVDLDDYKDSKELLIETKYQLGLENFNSKNYAEAQKYFNDTATYRDSRNYLNDITYIYLLESISNEEFDKAEELAAEIPEYKDVAYQKQNIIYGRFMQALDTCDEEQYNAYIESIQDEGLKTKAKRVVEFTGHGAPIINDIKADASSQGAQVEFKDVRCYQYSYNNNVEVPVYMFYTVYTTSDNLSVERYFVYLDSIYYGYCDTVDKTKLNMQDSQQLYAFTYLDRWDDATTYHLSIEAMIQLSNS